MPVIILIGNTSSYIHNIKSFFSETYKIVEMTGNFKEIRSILSYQEEDTLYLVPNLGKPERYEIFCLSRKNNQQFITLYDEDTEIFPSDKNTVKMSEFEGDLISTKLNQFRITPTTANKRSKGVSLKNIGELKSIINEINKTYEKEGNIAMILKGCEDRIMKMWNFNGSVEEAKECYKKMVEEEIKRFQ